MKDVSKEIRKMYCPNCGKSLISLEPYEKKRANFWCDDCLIDISVGNNGIPVEVEEDIDIKICTTLEEALKENHIGFDKAMESICIGYIDPDGKDDEVDFDVDNKSDLIGLFKDFLEENYRSIESFDKIRYVDIELTDDQLKDRLEIDSSFESLINKLIKKDDEKALFNLSLVLTRLYSDDFENNILDKIKDTISAVGVDIHLYYPRLVTKELEDGSIVTFVKEYVGDDDLFLPDDGEKF